MEHEFHSSAVTVSLTEGEGKIETLPPGEDGQPRVRIYCKRQGKAAVLEISEPELVGLLQKAIRAGVLSAEFLNDLKAEFVI